MKNYKMYKMKRTIIALFIGLLSVASLLTASVILAHHNDIIQTASCTGYTVKADYVGGSATRRVLTDVDFKLDNNPTEHINSDWRGVSSAFNIFTRTGTGNHEVKATGTVKLYSCEQSNDDLWTQNGVIKCDAGGINFSDDGWDLVDTDTFNLDFKSDCFVPTNPPTEAPTTEPTVEPTVEPTTEPTVEPTILPTILPTCEELQNCETPVPSSSPVVTPEPTSTPTTAPTSNPTDNPQSSPTPAPQTLGVKEMAPTGSFEENLFLSIAIAGLALTAIGIKKHFQTN